MGKKIILAVIAADIVFTLAWTKVIWQSGFDQGSDVALCVVASFQNDGKLAVDHPACKDAKAYQTNPLWMLRRRDGGRP